MSTDCLRLATTTHLRLLRAEHPDRMYEDDVAALTECAGQGLPKRALHWEESRLLP
jgi:hypothetical protein